MREYNDSIELPKRKEVIRIEYLPQFDIADYDLTNPKEVKKYFTSIERICRNSRCYKKLVSYLRDHVDMNKCSFYENIGNIDTYSVKIHIHHSPLTLFDIVTTIYSKRCVNGEPLSENMVAKEVMYVHYKMMTGLIPLSETVHELVHNGYLFIPTNAVYGKYREFVDAYEQYMDPTLKQTLERAEEASLTYDYVKETKLLDMHMVYIDPSGAYNFPSTSDIVKILETNVKNIEDKSSSVQYYNK